jgi:hypothetical protein
VRHSWLYLLLLPGVVYFATFKYAPMYGVTIAFQDYLPFLGFGGSPWVGLKHFESLFASPDFPRILGNTLILAGLNVVFVFPARDRLFERLPWLVPGLYVLPQLLALAGGLLGGAFGLLILMLFSPMVAQIARRFGS